MAPRKKCGPTIRNLSVSLSVTLVVCAGAITAALLYSAGEKAIDSTRDTGDRAFERAMRDGKTNVEQTMYNLINQIMNQINNDILAFLAPPARHTKMMADFMSSRPPSISTDTHWVNTSAREMLYHQFVQANREGLTALTIIQMLSAPKPVQLLVFTESMKTAMNPRPHGYHHVTGLECFPGLNGEPAHKAQTYIGDVDSNGYFYKDLPCDPRGTSVTLAEAAETNGAIKHGPCEKNDIKALSGDDDDDGGSNIAKFWTVYPAPKQAWGPMEATGTTQLYLSVYHSYAHEEQANRAFDAGCPRPPVDCVGNRVGMMLGTLSVLFASKFTTDIIGSLGMPDAAARMYVVQSDNPAGADVVLAASHGRNHKQLDEPASGFEDEWNTPFPRYATDLLNARESDDDIIKEHAGSVMAQCDQSCTKCGLGMVGTRAARQTARAAAPRASARRALPAGLAAWLASPRRPRPLNQTSPGGCVDDPTGEYEANGFGCSMLPGLGCETDLHSMSPQAAPGSIIKTICPVSCDNCPAACVDDADGTYEASGFGCSMLVGLGCDKDLNSMSPQAAPGTFIKVICPLSCDNCPGDGTDAPVAPTPVPPPPPPPTPAPPCEDDLLSWEDFAVVGSSTSQRRAGALNSGVIPSWTNAAGTSYYVAIRPITDSMGLQLHSVLLIEEDEAMKEIKQSEITVRAAMSSDQQKTDDDKNESMLVTVVIVVVIVCLLLLLSVVFALAITGPLKVLHDEMGDVAQMKLDSVDQGRDLSRLGEVRSMEKSFRRMVRSMIEYRSYMPQSLLVDDVGEEEEVMEESQREGGSVAGSKKSQASARSARSASQRGARSMHSSHQAGTVASSQTSLALRKHMAKHTAQGVKKKKVSLHVVNVIGFHKSLGKTSEDQLLHQHAQIVETVLTIVNGHKGVSDCFLGDRIFSGFNAVKPMGTHRVGCVRALADVRARLRESGGGTEVSRGRTASQGVDVSSSASSGDARVGNMGCPGMKKFGYFGSLVTWVHALERYNRHWGAGGMCDPEVQGDAKNSFQMREVDMVSFAKHSPKPIRVFEVMGMKDVSEDEWMYQLEEGEKSDPFMQWAQMMAAYYAGDWPAAKQCLAAVIGNPACDGEPRERLSAQIQAEEKHSSTVILYH